MSASRNDTLSTLEGAIAVATGLVEAVYELSSDRDAHAARRLSAINAVCTALVDELRSAGDAVTILHAVERAEQAFSTG